MQVNFYRFDQLSKAQLYSLLALRTDVFVVEQNCPYPELDHKDQEAIHVLFYHKESLAGTARIFLNAEGKNKLGRICIGKSFRKKGLGKKLVADCIHYCHEQNSLPIHISAQQYLERFYNELGFTSTQKKYLEDGIPHMLMTLP